MRVKLTEKLNIDAKSAVIIIIALGLIVYFGFFYNNDGSQGSPINEDVVQCIASNSEIYISTGCVACQAQEEMFGNHFESLDIIDCVQQGDKCSEANISAVPTWVINGERYRGVQPIEKLINLTGCSGEK
ncbi:MAG: hypothetical protein R6U32_04175 [Candidatus Woesearchaeota archaeon]